MLSQPFASLGSPPPRSLLDRLRQSPTLTPQSKPHQLRDHSSHHRLPTTPASPSPLQLQRGLLEPATSISPQAQYLSPQLRDAEHSIDYLCHKFEALSRQLHHEEQAREAAEHRGRQLAAESLEAEKYKDMHPFAKNFLVLSGQQELRVSLSS